MLKLNDIRNMNKKELYEKIDALKAELLALRFQSATGQLKNTADISNTKKDIAKVYTVIYEITNNITYGKTPKVDVSKQKKNTKSKDNVSKNENTVKETTKKETTVSKKPVSETKQTTKPKSSTTTKKATTKTQKTTKSTTSKKTTNNKEVVK